MTPHRIRRLAFASAATISVFLASLAAAGMANASGGSGASGDLPETFKLAERHAGDRGTIVTSWDDGVATASASVSTTHLFVEPEGRMTGAQASSSSSASVTNVTESFEWLPEEAWRDGSGAWHAVHGFLSVDRAHGLTTTVDGQTTFTPSWDIAWFDTAPGNQLGQTEMVGGGASSSSSMSGSEQVISTDTLTTWVQRDVCGLAAALRQGVDLDGDIMVSGCDTGPTAFRATAVEVLDGVEAVRFDATLADGALSYWFNPGIPEPIRVLSTPNEGLPVEWRLTSFERGDGVWDTGLQMPASEKLPTVDLAARKPWGPDDQGVGHPFPLSQAWTKAAADPTFPDFALYLRDHPDAAAVDASYRESRSGSQTDRSWHILIWSKGGPFYLVATQTEQYAGGPVTDVLGMPPVGPPVVTYAFYKGSVSMNDPGRLPEKLPTVASAMAFWKAFTGSKDDANTWGLQACYPDCGLQVQVGRETYDHSGQASGTNSTDMFLLLGPDGRATGLLQVDSTYTRTASGMAAGGMQTGVNGSSRLAASSGLRAVPLSMSAIPLTGSAGASFLALLSGLLVWFWPAIKGSPLMGLFSRLREDKLLDHPVRQEILLRVEAEPGIHYQGLLREVGGGKGSLEHHLRKLENGRLVRAVRGPYYTCYFPWSVGQAARDAAPALKSEGARKVLAAAQARPGITGQELASSTGLSASSVSEHVKHLVAVGLLRANRDGRSLRVEPSAAGARAAA